jgi:hypothetical protein
MTDDVRISQSLGFGNSRCHWLSSGYLATKVRSYFTECIITIPQQVGFWLRILSTIIWMYAQIPQLVLGPTVRPGLPRSIVVLLHRPAVHPRFSPGYILAGRRSGQNRGMDSLSLALCQSPPCPMGFPADPQHWPSLPPLRT